MMLNLMKINPLARAAWKKTIRLSCFPSVITQRHIQEFPTKRFDNRVRSDYVLVLPEHINEKPDTNELLRIPKVGQPENDFTKISVESAYRGLNQAICSFEDFLVDINNSDAPHDKNLKDIFHSIEEHLMPMDTAYNLLIALIYFKSTDYQYKEISDLIARYRRVRDSRTDGTLGEYFETFSGSTYAALHPRERCMLHFYREFNPKVKKQDPMHLESIRKEKEQIVEEVKDFRANLNYANQLFKHTIDDPDLLAAMSNDFNNSTELHRRERTPLQVTYSTYNRFMQTCPDRFIRQAIWATKNKRCSPKALPRLNNTGIILSLRTRRRKLAHSLGYRTHVDRKLSQSIAKTKQNVVDNLIALGKANAVQVEDRLQELNEFAADNMFEDPQMLGIQEYDVDYWSHRYIYDVLIGRSEAEIRNFFPLATVQDGVHTFFKNYFDLDLQIIDDQKGRMWHKDVQLIRVSKQGKSLGNVFIDPYSRSDKILTDPTQGKIRSRCEKFNCNASNFISTSFNRSSENSQIKLKLTEVVNFFYCYSTAVQEVLYNSGYHELNTSGYLEPDAISLFPYLCMSQLLMDYRIIQVCSDRGGSKPIPSELASRIIKGLTYFRPLETWKNLYMAHLDMEAHTVLSDIRALATDIYKLYSPFVRDADNYDYCGMGEIFVGPNDGLQYAGLWSKQLASFCLSTVIKNNTDHSLSAVNIEDIRALNVKLTDQLFDSENLDTVAKLVPIVGQSFKPLETSLGVL